MQQEERGWAPKQTFLAKASEDLGMEDSAWLEHMTAISNEK